VKKYSLVRGSLLELGLEHIIAMKINRATFSIGLLIYIASFFLLSVAGPGSAATRGQVRGYLCAWFALIIPWAQIESWPKGILPILMPATVIVGLINPIFIASVIVLLKHIQRPFVVLRIIVLCMFPFCLIPFFFGFRPREGFAVWIVGMLLVLFSNRRDQPSASISLSKTPLAS
jgi:hypothetical protein